MGNVFTRAYVRGITERLVNGQGMKVASLDVAAIIADSVGDRVNYPIFEKAATASLVAEIADEVLKISSEADRLVDGSPGQANTSAAAAAASGGIAKLEDEQRPAGSYLTGPGNTSLNTLPGQVGKIVEAPSGDDKANSVNEEAKTAAIRALLRKLSSDALVTGADPTQKNTLENAAVDFGSVAALEAAQRPTDAHLVGVGNTALPIPGAAQVGREVILPGGAIGAPALPAPMNSVVAESAKSAAFVDQFKKTAEQILPLLPHALMESDKIAAVRTCMGLSSVERLQYLSKLSEDVSGESAAEDAGEADETDDKKCDMCGKDPEDCKCANCSCDKGMKGMDMTPEEKNAALNMLSKLAALGA